MSCLANGTAVDVDFKGSPPCPLSPAYGNTGPGTGT